MSEKKLIETLRAQGVKVSVLCETSKNKKAPFAAFCTESFDEKLFKKTKSLHGRYLPEKKTILIRSSASKGSLIHEYLHYLQSENKNPIYGKVYKNTRNRLQKKLTSVMDEEIRFIENAKKTGEGAKEAPKHLQRFMQALEGMRSFSKWQDLIDERGLFLLYINFGKQLGVPQEDIDFAKKNMGFICRRKDLKGLLPAHQCS